MISKQIKLLNTGHYILVACFWIFSVGFFRFRFQVHGLNKRLMTDILFFLSVTGD